METERVEILTQIRTINHTNRWTTQNLEMKIMSKNGNENNRAEQLNPNNDKFYQARGYEDKDDYADKHGFWKK